MGHGPCTHICLQRHDRMRTGMCLSGGTAVNVHISVFGICESTGLCTDRPTDPPCTIYVASLSLPNIRPRPSCFIPFAPTLEYPLLVLSFLIRQPALTRRPSCRRPRTPPVFQYIHALQYVHSDSDEIISTEAHGIQVSSCPQLCANPPNPAKSKQAL